MTSRAPVDDPPTDQTRRRGRLVLRAGRWLSLRVDRRTAIAFTLALLLALLTVALTLTVGIVHVPLREVIRAITGGGNHFDRLIVHTFREPRVLTALFVGACLGMSGAIFQNIAGNPLVSPDIVGITTGAALARTAMIVLTNKAAPELVALAGSLLAAALVFTLSLGGGRSRYRMVLIGLGVNAALGAAIAYLRTQANYYQAQALGNLAGTVAGASYKTLAHLVVPAVILMTIGTALGRQLELLQLGEHTATGLGTNVREARLLLLVVGAGLAAISVAAAGTIGFVAFIAPHIARRLAGTTGNGILPLSAAAGAALVVIADYAAQRVFEPIELPVGILTSLIGGPYFLWLLLRSAKTYAL